MILSGAYPVTLQHDLNPAPSGSVYPKDTAFPHNEGFLRGSCRDENGNTFECWLPVQPGTHPLTARSAVLDGDSLYVASGNTLFAFSLPRLDLQWHRQVDDSTCFGLYLSTKHRCLIVHGELEVSRVDFDGRRVWSASGSDVLTGPFRLLEDHVEATDYEGVVLRTEIVSGK